MTNPESPHQPGWNASFGTRTQFFDWTWPTSDDRVAVIVLPRPHICPDNDRVAIAAMVAFASLSENDGFQFTTPPVRTRSESVLRTPKYKVCEELMKQQLDESMDISLNSVHCDDDAEEEEEIRSNSSSNKIYTTNERGRDAVFRLIDVNGDGFLLK